MENIFANFESNKKCYDNGSFRENEVSCFDKFKISINCSTVFVTNWLKKNLQFLNQIQLLSVAVLKMERLILGSLTIF